MASASAVPVVSAAASKPAVAPAHSQPYLEGRIVQNLVNFDDRDSITVSPGSVTVIQAAAHSLVRVLTRAAMAQQAAVGGAVLTRTALTAAVLASEEAEFFADFVPETDTMLPLAAHIVHSHKDAATVAPAAIGAAAAAGSSVLSAAASTR